MKLILFLFRTFLRGLMVLGAILGTDPIVELGRSIALGQTPESDASMGRNSSIELNAMDGTRGLDASERPVENGGTELSRFAFSLPEFSRPDLSTFRFPFTSREQADISDPGPDSPDFPDSSRCVPPGVVYMENAVVYGQYSHPAQAHSSLAISELIRFGMWEDFELRLSGSPFMYQDDPTTAGMSPITFGFKQNWWKESPEQWIPGVGLEGGIAVPVGPDSLNSSNRWLPYLSLNVDQSLPGEVALNMSFIPSWQIGGRDQTFVQSMIQWSFSREFDFLEGVEFFQHGYVGLPNSNGERSCDTVVGVGYIWYVDRRVAIDSSYNLGTSTIVARHGGRIGLSLAF